MTDTENTRAEIGHITEAGVIADLAATATEPTEHGIEGGLVLTGAYPKGWQIQHLDLVQYEARPRRKIGTTKVADTDGLLAYIDLQLGAWDEGTTVLPTIYHEPKAFRATAVFNDHTDVGPGWGDHRAVLQRKDARADIRAHRLFLQQQEHLAIGQTFIETQTLVLVGGHGFIGKIEGRHGVSCNTDRMAARNAGTSSA